MEERSVTFNEPSDIKNAWIAALNSGKYTQTNGALRNSKGYCCLGVLCDVVAPSKWETSLPRAGPDGVSYRLDHFHHSLGRAGEIYPHLFDQKLQHALIEMNDGRKFPFGVIAKYIEKNIPAEEFKNLLDYSKNL
jgi:hypothetical protein